MNILAVVLALSSPLASAIPFPALGPLDVPNRSYHVKLDLEVAERDPFDYNKVIKRSEKTHEMYVNDWLRRAKSKRLYKRDGNSTANGTDNDAVVLVNNRTTVYLATIGLGTPFQNFSVQIDTGSSDFWVYAESNPYCSFSSQSVSKRDYTTAAPVAAAVDAPVAAIGDETDFDSGFDFSDTDTDFGLGDETTADYLSSFYRTFATTDDETSATLSSTSRIASRTASSSIASSSTASGSSASSISRTSSVGTATSGSVTASKSFSSSRVAITRTPVITPYYNTIVKSVVVNTPTVSRFIDCNTAVFKTKDSSSFQGSDHGFQIGYVDNSFAQGKVVQDTLAFGDYVINQFTFGIADQANSSNMVFGIGYVSLESLGSYDNFPLRLVDSGYIQRTLYSLYLKDVNAHSGTVLFGAIDQSKYTGNLTTLKVLNLNKLAHGPNAFYVTLDSVDVVSNNGSSHTIASAKHPALFDSGTSYLLVPEGVFGRLGTSFEGVSFIDKYGSYLANCNALKNYTLDFTFSGQVYHVPLSVFGVPMTTLNKQSFFTKVIDEYDKDEYCFLEIDVTEDNTFIAGDALLRYFYVVYDLDYDEISIAQAVFDDNAPSKIVDIDSTMSLPGATRAPQYTADYEGNAIRGSGSDGVEPAFTGTVPTGKSHLNAGDKIGPSFIALLVSLISVTWVLL